MAVALLAWLVRERALLRAGPVARKNSSTARGLSALTVRIAAAGCPAAIEKAGGAFRQGMRDPESLAEEDLTDFIFLLHGAMLRLAVTPVRGYSG